MTATLVEDEEPKRLRAMAGGSKPFKASREWECLSGLDSKELEAAHPREVGRRLLPGGAPARGVVLGEAADGGAEEVQPGVRVVRAGADTVGPRFSMVQINVA